MIDSALLIERLGPLPIINHFIARMGLDDVLARHVPSDQRSLVPHSRSLGVLLRSIIVEREPIYRQQETVNGFAAGMFGVTAEEMEHLGDDRIGRALDHLFDADRAALLTDVVLAVGQIGSASSRVAPTSSTLRIPKYAAHRAIPDGSGALGYYRAVLQTSC